MVRCNAENRKIILLTKEQFSCISNILCQYHCGEFTFFLISVSVSVPADLELTGESVPSTESSLRNFSGEEGWMCEFPWCRDIPIEVGGCVFNVIGVDVAISVITVVLLLLKVY